MWGKLSKVRFVKAIEKGECPICQRVEETEKACLEEVLMDLVDDVKFRERLKSSKGFCLTHFRKMLLTAERKPELDGIGISDILQDLVDTEIQDLLEVRKELGEIRSRAPLPMDKEWERIVKALKKMFGRV